MAVVLEWDAAVSADAKGSYLNWLQQTVDTVLNLPGCFFQTCEVFDRAPDADHSGHASGQPPTSIVCSFRIKTRAGLDNYLVNHAPKINSSLGVFGDSVKVATRIFARRGDVIYPRSKAELPSFKTAAESKAVRAKKPVSASVFEGTVGITSAKAGLLAHRFDGEVKARYGTVNPNAEGGPVAGMTQQQSKNTEARFFEQGLRKGVAIVHADSKGITTAAAAGRDDSIRFENSEAALGRTHAAVVGEGTYAGVGSNSQAHEIDRYHVEPKTKVGYAVDDGAPFAGVGASMQPRYIDRYHAEPKARLVTKPTDDGTVAGVVSTSAPHILDRYHVEPRVVAGPKGPVLDGTVAGVTTSASVWDRYHGDDAPRTRIDRVVQDGGVAESIDHGQAQDASAPAPADGADAEEAGGVMAGVSSNRQPSVIDRFITGQARRAHQPPGGRSTFTFG